MKVALATVCPDARQRRFFELARVGWEAYARRHSLELVIVERPPHPEHVFWGKYFLLGMPEFSRFDAVLHLDNDILVNPSGPSVVEVWDPDRFAMIDERKQLHWDTPTVRTYFKYYDLHPTEAELESVLILNGGVFLATRQHLPFFEDLYARWKDFVGALSGPQTGANRLRFIADQPHVTLALQRAGIAQELAPAFNRLFPAWFRDEYPRIPYKALLIYTKSVQILRRRSPALARRLGRPGGRMMARAKASACFLHVAGSKSPMDLAAFMESPSSDSER